MKTAADLGIYPVLAAFKICPDGGIRTHDPLTPRDRQRRSVRSDGEVRRHDEVWLGSMQARRLLYFRAVPLSVGTARPLYKRGQPLTLLQVFAPVAVDLAGAVSKTSATSSLLNPFYVPGPPVPRP
jgi:hypothetical protein